MIQWDKEQTTPLHFNSSRRGYWHSRQRKTLVNRKLIQREIERNRDIQTSRYNYKVKKEDREKKKMKKRKGGQ